MKTIALALLLSTACTTGWYTDRLAERGLKYECRRPLGTNIARCEEVPMSEVDKEAWAAQQRQQGQVEAARNGDRR